MFLQETKTKRGGKTYISLEPRPVDEVLRDLQEVHRATLTVDGVVVRRLASHPPKAVAALVTRLNLWDLFETPAAAGRK